MGIKSTLQPVSSENAPALLGPTGFDIVKEVYDNLELLKNLNLEVDESAITQVVTDVNAIQSTLDAFDIVSSRGADGQVLTINAEGAEWSSLPDLTVWFNNQIL